MSDLDLYADLITRKLVSRDGGAVTLSPLVLGDQLRCSLRTFERSEGGDLRERDLRVRTLRASIGRVLTAPTARSLNPERQDELDRIRRGNNYRYRGVYTESELLFIHQIGPSDHHKIQPFFPLTRFSFREGEES